MYLDEAKWGLDWLLKMHPKDDWLFNQIGDDRDHRGMRIPKEDTNFYGRGFERPVYFCNGKPQQRGKFMNNTTGVASTAGKFAVLLLWAVELFFNIDKNYAANCYTINRKLHFNLGLNKPGVAQTASVFRLTFMQKITGRMIWNSQVLHYNSNQNNDKT